MTPKDREIGTLPFPIAPIVLVVGHYGVGKTNLSLNLAFDIKLTGKEVTLIDLDVVNPYFRTSDYAEELNEAGIHLIKPAFAGTNLDVPSLSGAIEPVLKRADEDHIVILDIGGDEVGTTALGRFANTIKNLSYVMIYVINGYRTLTKDPQEVVSLLKEIESKAHLKASYIVNNSHLKQETTLQHILDTQDFANQCAEQLGLPLVATTVTREVLEGVEPGSMKALCSEPKSSMVLPRAGIKNPYLVQIYVRTLWEK